MTVTVAIDSPALLATPEPAPVRVEASSVYAGVEPTFTPGPYGRRVQLIVKRHGAGGTRYAELHTAQVGNPTWVLNGIGDLTFTVPADDPTLLHCLHDVGTVDAATMVGEPRFIGREVQLWIDGEQVWAGVPISGEFDGAAGTIRVECADLGWYLSRRFMGAAERRDLLGGNGQMDTAGLPGWRLAAEDEDGITITRDTAQKVRGRGAMRMSGDGHAYASFVYPEHTNKSPITILLTAMVRLQSATPVGTTIASIRSYAGGAELYPENDGTEIVTTEATQLGGWTRVGGYCRVPPGGATVKVRLYNFTSGARHWDDVRVLKNDTTGSPPEGDDLSQHGVRIILHAQRGRGKGPFGLTPVVLANTGVVERIDIQHAEHTQVLDLLNSYADRDDGFDWWIRPQNRTIYFAPRRGKDHAGLSLNDFSVLSGSFTVDESDRSSAVVVPGDGDGASRPEGGYTSTERTDGLVLDHYHRPPNGTQLSALDPLAKGVWQQVSLPQVTFDPVRVPADWWPEVSPGDRFQTDFQCGVFRPPGAVSSMRVQQVTWDLEADVLELV